MPARGGRGRGGRGGSKNVAESKAGKMMHSRNAATRSIGATYLGSNNGR